MLDPMTYVGIAFGLGAGAGALSAYLGWSSSNETFDAKKFTHGVITGMISGLILVFGSLAALKGAVDEWAVLTIYGLIIGTVLGVDMTRTKVSGMVANRAIAKTNGSTSTKPPS
jgi:hypothetical protein